MVNIPPFCKMCKGHGFIAYVVRPSFQSSRFDGKPWSKTVDESRDALRDVIRARKCPRCHGDGHEPSANSPKAP